MRKSCPVLLGCTFALLGGCTMIPSYSRPQAPIPTTLPANSAPTTMPAAPLATDLPWQDFIADDKLRQVIATALANNRDLRLAMLNVERAQGVYGVQRADLLPKVNGTASMSRARIPADLSGTGKPLTSTQYDVNLGVASWEIDFFGRIRSLKEEALFLFLASQEAQRSAQVLLISQVASYYLTLAADRENLHLAQTTLEAQLSAYDLVKRRYNRGIVPELDLYRAQTQVDTARVDTARFTQLVAIDENALNLLLGATLPPELQPADLQHVLPPRDISAGVSSAVLLQRPDILQAENQLKAANADIGAARAAFFPKITLTATGGTASSDLSGLFKSGSGAWSFAPQISLPVFDPRTWSAIKVSKADQQLALTRYEKAIQVSFREVADSLAVHATVDQQVSAQESLVHAVAETYRLANARYSRGVDSYLSVLDAQRSLYGAQQGLVSLHLAKLANQIQLYAVLGGGWQTQENSAATPTTQPAK